MVKQSFRRKTTTILIIGHKPILRLGLARLCEQETDLHVVGEATSADESLQQVDALRPDLALIGLPLNGELNLELIARIKAKHPPIKILVGTRISDSALARQILQAEADGCVCWQEPLTTVLTAVRAVLRGELYLGGFSTQPSQQANGRPVSVPDIESLTEKQASVFTMIGQGLTTQEIASKLEISPRTIETHRKNIKLRLRIANCLQLNRCAYEWYREYH